MARMGLEPIYQRPRTTIPHPGHRIYPYLLRDMLIDRPNQVWCADITYIPMRRGFHYLIAIMDWSTRKVLSWRVSNTMDVEFCIEALEEAMARFGCPEIFNTDSKNDGVGRLRRSPPRQNDQWPEHRRHCRASSVALTRTPIDRALRLSLDLSGG